MKDWTQKAATQAEVRLLIREKLWGASSAAFHRG
jgi:hypothetical protein